MASASSTIVKSASPCLTSDNRIKNTKYTALTFLLMMVKMNFENASSIFFSVIIIVQLSKKYRVTSLVSSFLPWSIIFIINVLREAFDNYNRYIRDREINRSLYKKFMNNEFSMVESQSLKTGDILLLEKNQRVPADCLLLKSEEISGEIFIRTDQLDGETDWKRRNALPETQQCSVSTIMDIEVEVEKPSKDIYSFNGKLKFNNFTEGKDENLVFFQKSYNSPARSIDLNDSIKSARTSTENLNSLVESDKILKSVPVDGTIGEDSTAKPGKTDGFESKNGSKVSVQLPSVAVPKPEGPVVKEIGVDLDNTIWANTVIASCPALCMVIYTGHDTRSMMNTLQPRNKTGIIDTELDMFVRIMAILSFCCSFIFAYEKVGFSINTTSFVILFRFLIIFSYVIPISLKFMMTTARAFYVYLLSKDETLNTVKVMTNTLQEELARISFFLTDKTGTLTKNEMIMRKLHIGTICYNAENIEEIRKSIEKVIAKVNVLRKMFWKKSKSIDTKIYELLEAMSVCHNVNPIESQEGLSYQASSPDEIAMANYASEIGLKLIRRDQSKIVIQDINGAEVEYKIQYMFPFNSDTKRMGIIVKKDEDYIFFEKGADTVMKSIVKENDWIEEETDNMAREGLRTLVIAKKVISNAEFLKFSKAYNKAKTSLVDRNELMLAEQRSLEVDLDVVGLTGVEDKLQDKVKQTLESIRNAGIKIWMLTGDKIETAISIAFSSRLLTRNDQFMIISKCASKEEVEKHLDILASRGYNALVIDGLSLGIIIEHLLAKFIDIAKNLHCLVGCRYSPTQKAIMASALRLRAKETVLCIGDGGNDVSMITSADVGVGIEGKEGSQASLAADFSLKNFSDVADLMFCHGRRCYKNSSKMAHIIFHRGILLSTIQGIFCCFIHFFPISILIGAIPSLFIIFTILPLFWIIYDQDIPNVVALKYPELYKELRENNLLSIRQFFITLTVSVFQASAFMLLLCIRTKFTEMFSLSIACFTNLVINEQLMVVLSVWESFNYRLILTCLASVFVFFIYTFTVENYYSIMLGFAQLGMTLLMNFLAILPKLVMTVYKIYINPPSHIKIQKQN